MTRRAMDRDDLTRPAPQGRGPSGSGSTWSGVAPAVAARRAIPHFLDWLDAGHAAGMDYLARQAEVREHPEPSLDGVRSVVVVSLVYGRPDPTPPGPTQGKVARYARGGDYHELLWRRLEALLDWLRAERPGAAGRAVADTAPLLERDFARLAGLGWIGKNTMLIDRRLGSFTVLGALLVDVELAARRAARGRATAGPAPAASTPARPTPSTAPYQLDARRCISYWTIEHKGPIPDEFADRLDGWAFGCDVCQDVCPWNRKAPPAATPELDARPGLDQPRPASTGSTATRPSSRRSIKGTALCAGEALGPAPQRRPDPRSAPRAGRRPGADRSSWRIPTAGARVLGLGPGPDRVARGRRGPGQSSNAAGSGGIVWDMKRRSTTRLMTTWRSVPSGARDRRNASRLETEATPWVRFPT